MRLSQVPSLAVCLAILALIPASGQVSTNLPSGVVERAVTAIYNVKPSNDSTSFSCDRLGNGGSTGNTTVFFSLLEQQASNGQLEGFFNVGFWTPCGNSEFIQNTFLSAYQPPQWRPNGRGQYVAVFPAVPGGSGLFGRATVIICPEEGEAMNHIFKFEMQRVGLSRNGWDYGVFTFYYYDAAFC